MNMIRISNSVKYDSICMQRIGRGPVESNFVDTDVGTQNKSTNLLSAVNVAMCKTRARESMQHFNSNL